MKAREIDTLALVPQRPVNDNIGLTGFHDFQLQWMPDETERSVRAPATASGDGPSLFQAIQEQLGLRLQATKTATRVLVIDKIERSEEN